MSHAPHEDSAPRRANATVRETVPPWWWFGPLRNALLAGAIAGGVWIAARTTEVPREFEIAAFALAILIGGWHWVREAIETLVRERAIDIEFLMLAAAGGSIALGMWDEAAALVVLFGVAEGVEEYTHERTRNAVRSLMSLVPEQASVVDGERETVRPATELAPGMRFRVRPGERLPTDGRIVEGQSELNQAPVTGESMPVSKEVGDEVFAGSINGEGVLLIEATRAFADNSIARIVHLVERAQEEKGRAQQWIERFGRRYTPSVFALAAALVVIPWFMGLPLAFWAQKAVVLLVAAAPCALVIATPVAMAAAIRRASQNGVLIKGGVHLEHLAAIKFAAFDKTGTLTVGEPRLLDFEVIEGGAEAVLAIAAGIEQHSRHPLATAVVAAARERGITPSSASEVASLTGNGIGGLIDGSRWYVASASWFEQRGIAIAAVHGRIGALRAAGRTVSLVGNDTRIVAIMGLADAIRPEASEAIRLLHSLRVKTALLSGDHAVTARSVATSLAIDDARGDLKPEHKVTAVQDLAARHGAVLMVGDGVNDAPALAAATCSAAMGAAGSDAAIEAADVALMSEDLRKIAYALALGRDCARVSRQNIVLSLLVLAAMIPAALFGWIGVTTAVVVHEAAELLAVANGLRAGAGAQSLLTEASIR